MLSWQKWAHGLFAAFIGGGASAGSSWMGMAGAKSLGLDVPVLNWKALGIVFLASGLVAAFAYLKQSPLPTSETTVTTTTKLTETVQETPKPDK